MASVRRTITIHCPAAQVWDAMRDVGALHTRLVAGFVTDCVLEEGGVRQVTFANGMKAKEVILDVNDKDRRIAWMATGGQLSHYNASAQVMPGQGDSCEVVWIADLLPHAMAPAIAGLIEQGLAAMKRTLDATRSA